MITAWMSKGFPGELITPPAILDNDLNPRLDYTDNPKIRKKKKNLMEVVYSNIKEILLLKQ